MSRAHRATRAKSSNEWGRMPRGGGRPAAPHRWTFWRPRVPDANGVMVISAWTDGAGAGFLARLTMSGAAPDPQIRIVASTAEVVTAVHEWLEELDE